MWIKNRQRYLKTVQQYHLRLCHCTRPPYIVANWLADLREFINAGGPHHTHIIQFNDSVTAFEQFFLSFLFFSFIHIHRTRQRRSSCWLISSMKLSHFLGSLTFFSLSWWPVAIVRVFYRPVVVSKSVNHNKVKAIIVSIWYLQWKFRVGFGKY